jgi:hypothetical protein
MRSALKLAAARSTTHLKPASPPRASSATPPTPASSASGTATISSAARASATCRMAPFHLRAPARLAILHR